MIQTVAADSLVDEQQSAPRRSPSYSRVDLFMVTLLALLVRLAWVWFGAWESAIVDGTLAWREILPTIMCSVPMWMAAA